MAFVEKTPDGILARLPAQFIQEAVQAFLSEMRAIAAGGARRVVVDFGDTDTIDSSAIGALVSIAKEVKAGGASLYIRNLKQDIRQLFAETGLDKIFNIETEGSVKSAEFDLFESSVDIKLDISVEISSDICILHLAGVMNHMQGSAYFKQQFLLAMTKHKKILLDLEELTFFDSLSVSVMLNMNKLLRETGGTMHICGANYIVLDLFNTLNIHRIIPTFNTAADALANWT